MRGWLTMVVLGWAVLLPGAVYAQASIAGTVRDTSGAVLPGVTIEAASPALIEKTRAAVSDGTGQYRIENVRPGIYSVTFTLAGFNTIRRTDIELSGSFTATVNADMRVGGVEETIVVTGETPIVDVQSAQRQTVLTRDVIAALPSAGSYNSLLVLVPGVFGGQQDVAKGPCFACTLSAHGSILSGRANTEGRLLLDGLSVAVPQAGGTNYLVDTRNAQEVTFTTSGSLGDVESGGPVMNIIPRTGGNAMSGNAFLGWANDALQGSNYTEELRNAGLTAPNPLIKLYDFNGAVAGPVRKDRLWFFTTARAQGSSSYISNMYLNKNAGNPDAWTYQPDLSQQAFVDRTQQNAALRLTSQITPRNKVNVFWDEQIMCQSCENGGRDANANTAPESNDGGDRFPQRVQQVSWTSPVTNRILLEFGFGSSIGQYGGRQKQNPNTGALVKMVEQCTAGCPANGNLPGLTYRSQSVSSLTNGSNINQTYTWRAILSHVTGARTLKVGYIGTLLGSLTRANTAPNNLQYRVNNAVPNQLTMFINNYVNNQYMRDDGLFVQQQWTIKRLTLQGGLRFDRAWSWAPEQQEGPARFLPTPIVFPRTPGVDSYLDLTPRMAATYDLFGNGKTALKTTFGKYLEANIIGSNYGLANPSSRITSSVTRSWIDANNNYLPDCDLLNPNAQDLRAGGGDNCGAFSNRNFGTTVYSNTIDADLLQGWGVRPSDWSFGVSVQHEILPRVSVEVGYFRRWFEGFTVTDNLNVSPADFGQFSITAPLDARLPDGGGYAVSGLYDVNSALFGSTNNFVTTSDRYGQQYQRFNGVDLNVTARPGRGLTVQGGFSGGRTTGDSCVIREALPETAPLNPYCHIVTGFLPQVKGLGAYLIPRVDVQFSATFTSKPGLEVSVAGTPVSGGSLAATYSAPNAAIVPSLGRSLSGGAANATVSLIAPGTLYGDRVNELDFRFAKVLKVRRTRTEIGVDIYNVLNSAAVLTQNQVFIPGGAWLTPTSVMSARFAKVSLQLDF